MLAIAALLVACANESRESVTRLDWSALSKAYADEAKEHLFPPGEVRAHVGCPVVLSGYCLGYPPNDPLTHFWLINPASVRGPKGLDSVGLLDRVHVSLGREHYVGLETSHRYVSVRGRLACANQVRIKGRTLLYYLVDAEVTDLTR